MFILPRAIEVASRLHQLVDSLSGRARAFLRVKADGRWEVGLDGPPPLDGLLAETDISPDMDTGDLLATARGLVADVAVAYAAADTNPEDTSLEPGAELTKVRLDPRLR